MRVSPAANGIIGSSYDASNGGAMAMVTTLFFLSGFLAALNDILIPHLKSIFDLNYAEVMLVQFSFFSAFLFFAVPSGKLVGWIGYKKTIVTGLCTMAIGSILFVPAADIPSFPLFMCALTVLAGGITSLQVSANPYVSVLGPAKTAGSRLNLTQAFNSLGSTVAPYFGGLLILSSSPKSMDQVRALPAQALHAYRLQQAGYVKLPYLGIAAALISFGLIFSLYKLPVLQTDDGAALRHDISERGVWKHRHLVLGVVGIFVCVGAEVAIGSFLVNYFSQSNIGAMTAKAASTYVSLYWAGAMMGRFLGSAVMKKVETGKVVGIAGVVVVALLTTSIISTGHLAMWSMLFVGLFNSIMFPSVFTLGIAELGPLTGKGSGILMAAAVGGAIVPVLQGALADQIGIHQSFILPAICYLYVAFYGFSGSKPSTISFGRVQEAGPARLSSSSRFETSMST